MKWTLLVERFNISIWTLLPTGRMSPDILATMFLPLNFQLDPSNNHVLSKLSLEWFFLASLHANDCD